MRYVARVLTSIVAVAMVTASMFTGCKTEDQKVLPSDPKEIYYTSQVYTLEIPEYTFSRIVNLKDKKAAIYYKWLEQNQCEYVVCTHKDGEETWDNIVSLDSNGIVLGSFCRVGENKIAATTYSGFVIFDPDTGKEVSRNDDLFVYIDGSFPQVASRDDGFVVVTSDCIYSAFMGLYHAHVCMIGRKG